MRFVLLIISVLTFNVCYATNYFVNQLTGANAHTGFSTLNAKKNIQQAADLSKPGDTIFVMNGNYTNDCPTCNVVNIPTSGSPNRYIVYTNYKNHRPKITFNGWAAFSIRNGISYVRIDGFEIIGNNDNVILSQALKQPNSCKKTSGTYDPKFNGNGIVIDGRENSYPHHIIISNNTIHGCGGGGISAIHTDYITVEDNVVYDTSWYSVFGTSGISFYQFWNLDDKKGYHNIIRRNKCYNNKSMVPWFKSCKIEDGNGIIIDDFMNYQNSSANGRYKGKTLIENNICWNNGGTGIHTFQSSNVDILNNTAYCNSRSKKLNAGEILAGSSSNIRIVNNILVVDHQNRINSNYQNKNVTYENNLHYNITTPLKMLVSISSATCLNGKDPMFKGPLIGLNADFSLQKNSPAINRANTQLYSLLDFEQKPRPNTEVSDIGAFEFSMKK